MAVNKGDPILQGDIFVRLAETTTPTAVANFGQLYFKSDNLLYAQDGAGVERVVQIGATGVRHLFVQTLDDPNATIGNWEVNELNAS